MTRRVVALVLGGVVLLALPGPAGAQIQAEVARLLRVELAPVSEEWTRPRLAGHVYNDSIYRIGSVRLRVQSLDGKQRDGDGDDAGTHYRPPAARVFGVAAGFHVLISCFSFGRYSGYICSAPPRVASNGSL